MKTTKSFFQCSWELMDYAISFFLWTFLYRSDSIIVRIASERDCTCKSYVLIFNFFLISCTCTVIFRKVLNKLCGCRMLSWRWNTGFILLSAARVPGQFAAIFWKVISKITLHNRSFVNWWQIRITKLENLLGLLI